MRKAATIDDVLYSGSDVDDDDIGIHSESYRSALWVYIGYKDELMVWGHKNNRNRDAVNGEQSSSLVRSESMESTMSEKQFRKQYESVTHRMIHRKASIEMYKRIINKTFGMNKTHFYAILFISILFISHRKANHHKPN